MPNSMSAPGDLWFAVEAVDVASVTKLGSELNLHGYRHADCNGATPFILAVSQIGDRVRPLVLAPLQTRRRRST